MELNGRFHILTPLLPLKLFICRTTTTSNGTWQRNGCQLVSKKRAVHLERDLEIFFQFLNSCLHCCNVIIHYQTCNISYNMTYTKEVVAVVLVKGTCTAIRSGKRDLMLCTVIVVTIWHGRSHPTCSLWRLARRRVQVGIDPRWREWTNKIIQVGGGREGRVSVYTVTWPHKRRRGELRRRPVRVHRTMSSTGFVQKRQ